MRATVTREVVLLGGPRDGEKRVLVPALAPPPLIAGCCMKPDPQAKDGTARCFSCGATDVSIGRYFIDGLTHTGGPLLYRHRPLRPRRERPAQPTT